MVRILSHGSFGSVRTMVQIGSESEPWFGFWTIPNPNTEMVRIEEWSGFRGPDFGSPLYKYIMATYRMRNLSTLKVLKFQIFYKIQVEYVFPSLKWYNTSKLVKKCKSYVTLKKHHFSINWLVPNFILSQWRHQVFSLFCYYLPRALRHGVTFSPDTLGLLMLNGYHAEC